MMNKHKKVYTAKEISLVEASSLQELLDKFEIDTNIWEVVRFVTNIWGNSNNPNHQIKAWLERKVENIDNRESFIKELVEEIKQYSPQVPLLHDNKIKVEKNILLINPSDLHLARLAWAVETGYGNYDIKIAAENLTKAIDILIRRANGFQIEEIIFILGNDYFNYNTSNPFPQTVNGTPQESDVRQAKMFRIGRRLACQQIERLSLYAKVKVMVIPGNHDEEIIFGLGEVLEAKYENNPNIIIDNSPILRKYFKYGINLLGFSHGKYEKRVNLPALMANEAKDWTAAEKQHRYFHTGHRHHEVVEDINGVLVLTAPTAAEVDSYEAKKGYTMSNRAIKAWIYNYDEGEIASFTHNLKSQY